MTSHGCFLVKLRGGSNGTTDHGRSRYAERRILGGVDGLRSPDVRSLLDFLDAVESVSAEDDSALITTVLDGLSGSSVGHRVVADFDYERHRNRMLSSDRRVGIAYEALHDRWWELYGQHPILTHRDRSGDYRALTLSDFAGRSSLRRLELYASSSTRSGSNTH